MTPDKDGWYVWNPGDPKPYGIEIYDVQMRWPQEGWEDAKYLAPLAEWSSIPRRYRLRPIDLSSIRPGDTVTLKPGPYVVTAADGESVDLGEGYTVSGNMIATHAPKPKSRVTDEMVRAFASYVMSHREAKHLLMANEEIRQALEAALAVKEEGE